MVLARLLAGVCALLLGRQLFWLFVGVVGFAVGMEIGARLFAGSSPSIVLAVSIVAGVAGALLARATEELMIAIVGFVAGSYLGALLLLALMPYPGRNIWFALFGGGIVGAVFVLSVFNWALIVLSALVGAGIILRALDVQLSPLLYLGLAAIGIVVQAGANRRRPPLPRI